MVRESRDIKTLVYFFPHVTISSLIFSFSFFLYRKITMPFINDFSSSSHVDAGHMNGSTTTSLNGTASLMNGAATTNGTTAGIANGSTHMHEKGAEEIKKRLRNMTVDKSRTSAAAGESSLGVTSTCSDDIIGLPTIRGRCMCARARTEALVLEFVLKARLLF